ncbi:hypothetical protein E3P81_04173 [Wallemia ichthyophaga]|nr:hypothetical protein E3P85_04187 [Wallemia ichthyophaga]TIB39588.1 hypothetical protein E3P82_04178 [Wallemia ichthyophaga]TIB43675.1 hypothetical protein E3P81_04173 [Wallemia ichthyophaga]TIB45188.1 hypothetical protein E3P80_04183 [Wallemia ichthyophaga]TIB52137.1 hypothetical protein E3P79_04173 [Wallemia ichthyophaga]
MLQQPEVARCSPLYDKDRRPVDPPPILQLQIYDKNGRLDDNALRWPYWVLHTSLATHTPSERPLQQSEILQGLLTSSAHYCANGDANSSGCFFYFSDLSFAALGIYQLKFTLISVLGFHRPHRVTSVGRNDITTNTRIRSKRLPRNGAVYPTGQEPG